MDLAGRMVAKGVLEGLVVPADLVDDEVWVDMVEVALADQMRWTGAVEAASLRSTLRIQ